MGGDGISTLIKETSESFVPFLPLEDRARRGPSMNQEEGPHQTLNCGCLDVGLHSLQNCEKYVSVVYKSPCRWYAVITPK